MMFDHVEYQVSSYENSLEFYSSCLSALGHKLVFSDEKGKMFGFGSGESTEILFTEGAPTTPPMHIAFRANSEEQVSLFYKNAISNGGKCNGGPGYRTDYGEGYYAAFVLDPDGHNIEALFRAGSPTL